MSHLQRFTLTLLLLASAWPAAVTAQIPVVQNQDYGPCGPVALYTVCRLRGIDVDWPAVVRQVGPADYDRQHSLAELVAGAEGLGLHPVAAEVTPDNVRGLGVPVLAFMRYSSAMRIPHFLAVAGADDEGVMIVDPPFPAMKITWDSFRDAYGGRVLFLAKTSEEADEIRSSLSSRSDVTWTRALVAVNAVAAVAAVLILVRSGRPRPGSNPTSAGAPNMPVSRWWLVAIGVLGVVLFATYSALLRPHSGPEGPEAAPVLRLEKDVIDLGPLTPGKYPVEAKVRNTSDRPLHLEPPVASCACTAVEAPTVLQPGEEGVVKLSVDVTPGLRTSEVKLFSDDPAGPRHLLVQWFGVSKPQLLPTGVSAARADHAKPYEATVELVYISHVGMTFHPAVAFYAASPAVTITGDKPRPHQSSAGRVAGGERVYAIPLTVKVAPPEKPSRFETEVIVEVAYGGSKHRLPLPVSVQFTRGLLTDPAALVFSAAGDVQLLGQKRSTALRLPSGNKVTVHNTPNWLRAEVLEESPGLVRLEVEVTKPIRGIVRHDLRVELADGRGGVDVPVTVVVGGILDNR